MQIKLLMPELKVLRIMFKHFCQRKKHISLLSFKSMHLVVQTPNQLLDIGEINVDSRAQTPEGDKILEP